MGFRHLNVAMGMQLGTPGRKHLLAVLAYRACDECGICWPGVPWLVTTTEMSERSVQRCLVDLSTAGHINVRRYSRGGRGVSTEYVVLPSLAKLAAAPCARCLERMKSGRVRETAISG